MQSKFILIFGVVLTFVVGLSLSSVNAISPFTEIGNLEMEVLNALNIIAAILNDEIARTDSLNSTQISELAEQDGMQTDIAQLQTDFDLTTIQIDSIMISLNTTIIDHRDGFNAGSGQNSSATAVVSHKTYENANVTVTLQYVEGSRQFGNGTARSFQLADDVLLLGNSKIFIDTFIVPLGVLFDGTQGLVESCVILPTEDPNICARTSALEPGDELKVLFKTDHGDFITGLNSNIITTRITAEVTT